MRMYEKVQRKIDEGNAPRYITNRGKWLWIADQYDRYSSATGTHILIGADDNFWGYSDNPNIRNL